jgi:hypothetical protein
MEIVNRQIGGKGQLCRILGYSNCIFLFISYQQTIRYVDIVPISVGLFFS